MPKLQIYIDPESDSISQIGGIRKNVEHNDDSRNVRPKLAPSWELCKENIQPLSQGRNIETLLESLAISNNKQALEEKINNRLNRFKSDCEALEKNNEPIINNPDNPQLPALKSTSATSAPNPTQREQIITNDRTLQDNESHQQQEDTSDAQGPKTFSYEVDSKRFDLYYDHINWLEQNIVDGGKSSLLTDAIEQCIEYYYNKERFKQDERLFNVLMKFKNFCDEPVQVFGFMYANGICNLFAQFYVNWSLIYEVRKNLKKAESIIELGISNLASPREVLTQAQRELKCRIARLIDEGQYHSNLAIITEEGADGRATSRPVPAGGIRHALQTLKFSATKQNKCRVPVRRVGGSVDRVNVGGLKSQTKIVNGVRVANSSKPPKPKSNIPVTVFNENNAEAQPFSMSATGLGASENSRGAMRAVKTSQRVSMLGKPGNENTKARVSLKQLGARILQ